VVAALLLDAVDRAAIEGTPAQAPVRLCERVDALRSLVATGQVRFIVSELRDRVGASVIPVLGEAAARRARPTIVVRTTLTDAAAGDVIQCAVARIPAHVSIREAEPLASAMRDALGSGGERFAGMAIIERVGPSVPLRLRAFVVLCAAAPSPRLHVARAAVLLGIGRRTIESRLARAELPPAYRIIGWCVALHAAWQLDVLGRRPKQVAASFGFASGAALANLLARYCGCSATSLREHGAFSRQLERFAALFERSAPIE